VSVKIDVGWWVKAVDVSIVMDDIGRMAWR
jgi:hypothetical protein